MLQPRIIPCLLVQNGGLVKTVNFGNPKYVGDPINAVKIFNEKEVDELIVLDIDASVKNREPDYRMIQNLATECRMPLCYGGGIKTVEQVERIISLGVEKAAISSAAVSNPRFIVRAAEVVGSQSVAIVLDVKKKKFNHKYEMWTHNAVTTTGYDPVAFAKEMESLGAGEIVINSIDRDGVMNGYDMALVNAIRSSVSLPVTVLGGAGSLKDISALFRTFGIIGAAAGSLFVFKGIYRAVLINYPNHAEKEKLYADVCEVGDIT
jgi:cyclase